MIIILNDFLLVDAGATKTAFTLIGDRKVQCQHTARGINPNYTPHDEIHTIFADFVTRHPEAKATHHIIYYGSGCASPANADTLQNIISQYFTADHIDVFSDLMAVCHALSRGQRSVCGIIGTGAATCLFDGQTIQHIAPSLGYMLGDEGSGTNLGKRLIISYLQNTLPNELRNPLSAQFQLTPETVIQRIYREPEPNRFMASLAPFVQQNLSHPFLNKLAFNAFRDFFNTQKKAYGPESEMLQWHLNGSVAYHFADLIREAATAEHCLVGKIIDSPMNSLIDYYTDK